MTIVVGIPCTSDNSWNVRIEELVIGIMITVNSLVMAVEFEFSGGKKGVFPVATDLVYVSLDTSSR